MVGGEGHDPPTSCLQENVQEEGSGKGILGSVRGRVPRLLAGERIPEAQAPHRAANAAPDHDGSLPNDVAVAERCRETPIASTAELARGVLEQGDTSKHDWLGGRGEKLYLIHLIDDATSELTGRFVRHDSAYENMRLL